MKEGMDLVSIIHSIPLITENAIFDACLEPEQNIGEKRTGRDERLLDRRMKGGRSRVIIEGERDGYD